MKLNLYKKNNITGIKSYVAEPLEMSITRKLNNGDSLNDKISLMYSTDDKILKGTNIREDRFDLALELKSKIEASKKLTSKLEIVKDDNDSIINNDSMEIL